MRNPDKLPGGTDICAEDGVIQWGLVKTNRTQFVMIKASEGGENGLPCSADAMFLDNVRNAYNVGLRVGAYHWITADSVDEAKAQASFFLKQISQAGVMINFYCGVVLTEWQDRDAAFLYADIFMGFLSAAGYKPIFYAPPEFFDGLKKLSVPLWIPCLPEMPHTLSRNIWNCAMLWQYKTDTFRGIDTDMMRSVLLHPEILMHDDFNTSVIPYKTFAITKREKQASTSELEWAIRLGIWRSEEDFNPQEEITREQLMIMYRRFYDMWEAAHR